ncbi:hypothetical protein ACI2OX_06360 [Bacillus sp. N9]
MGKWKEYWIKRLEQLEQVWQSTVAERPDEEFEKYLSIPFHII